MKEPRRFAAAAAFACALGLLPAAPLLAQAPPAGGEEEEMIVTVRANEVPRGEFPVIRTATGDFLLAEEDLRRLKVAPLAAARRERQGQAFYSLQAQGATNLAFDEAQLALSLDLPSDQFAGTVVDLSNRPAPVKPTLAQNSAVFNYRAAARGGAHAPPQLVLDTELNIRAGELLLRQEAKVETGRDMTPFARGPTQLIWDNRLEGRRVLAGDQLTLGGPFGTSITAAGVSVSRLFEMTPDVLRQPTASLSVNAVTPSTVEVTVDGVPVYRERVAPGPVNLHNLFYLSGVRTVQVTVTDAAGRRQVIEQPFLFTDSALAQGVHEYSYFAGRRSQLRADDRLQYLETIGQGYHRYGLTDRVTLEGSAEGSTRLASGAAGVTLRSDSAGLLSMAMLSSTDRLRDRRGHGWSARYTYLGNWGSVVIGRRRVGRDFVNLASAVVAAPVLEETRAAVATRLADWGSVSLDWSRVRDAFSSRTSYALRTSSYINRRTLLTAELVRSRTPESRDWAANVYLRYELEARQWVGATVRGGPDFHGIDVEAGKQVDQGEGFGYRVGTSHSTFAGQRQAFAFGSANWNLRSATVELNGSSQVTGGSASFYEAAVSGALVAVQGYAGVTRQVPDSFAVARLGVPHAGVDVFLNSQVQGKTDADGVLLIPNVGAFGRQDVSIDDKQVPLQYTLSSRRVTIAPPFRSGTVVEFGGRKLRALAGQVFLVQDGKRIPLASRVLRMTAPAGTVTLETALEGDFYLEDAPPGSYTGTVEAGGRRYSCRMDVPVFDEEVHELKEGARCE